MRFLCAVFGLAAAACLTMTPVYAQSRSAAAMTHGGKPTTTGKPMTTGKSSRSTSTTTSGSAAATSGSTTPKSTTSTPLNPIAAKISSHPQLNTKITALLPAHMTLNQASAGYKNQGQFIAALHVSRNLGISFKDLKADMTTKHMSLGQAIQDVRHTATATATTQASKAEREADDDVKSTTTTTTPTSGKNSKTKTHKEDDR